jgi:predicted GIY-YIG superfamily endonuclease
MAKLGLAIHEFRRDAAQVCLALHHGESAKRHDLCGRDERSHCARLATSHRCRARVYQALRLERLVYVEQHEAMPYAITREKNVKSWPRAWRIRLITTANPNWDDLYENVLL